MRKIAAGLVLIFFITFISSYSMSSNYGIYLLQTALAADQTKNQGTFALQSTSRKDWFTGAIGTAKIHLKLNIEGTNASGIYYYDKYKTNITIKGSVDDFQKDYKTLYLTESTVNKGQIQGIFRTKDYFQGFFKNGNKVYPVYLIREGSKQAAPKVPSKYSLGMQGHWTGKQISYFSRSEADIKVLFSDLIYFELNAFNGTHSGSLDGFAIIKNNIAKTVYKDKTYGDKPQNVFFEFSMKNSTLNLNSNMYDYYCGMGVGFDSKYVKGNISVLMPSALEVGIVDTKEQDVEFKRLVGDMYEDFIAYTQFVDYSDTTLDGEKAKAGNSYLRGYYGCCSYILTKEHIYAAIGDGDAIYYFTNDKKYSSKLPKPIADWASSRDSDIIYTYK